MLFHLNFLISFVYLFLYHFRVTIYMVLILLEPLISRLLVVNRVLKTSAVSFYSLTFLIMVKTQEHSVDLRNKIIDAHKIGEGYRLIGKRFKVHPSTVGSIIRKWKTHHTTLNLTRAGAPKKISNRALNRITRTVSDNPHVTRKDLVNDLETVGINVTKRTVTNALRERGLQSYAARKTPLLTKRNIKARLEFANNFLSKPASYWNNVIWSDESKIELFNHSHQRQVWRKKGEEFKPNNTIPTVKFGGGNIMVWGCFSSSGTGKIHIIKERMNSAIYREILEENLFESVEMLNLGQDWIFQQDNDPKHRAKLTQKWLVEHNINVLPWPSQSPDLNPIENLWRVLKVRVSKRQPRNLKQLEQICKEEWSKIPPNVCQNLVSKYRKRLHAVVSNKGNATKY